MDATGAIAGSRKRAGVVESTDYHSGPCFDGAIGRVTTGRDSTGRVATRRDLTGRDATGRDSTDRGYTARNSSASLTKT